MRPSANPGISLMAISNNIWDLEQEFVLLSDTGPAGKEYSVDCRWSRSSGSFSIASVLVAAILLFPDRWQRSPMFERLPKCYAVLSASHRLKVFLVFKSHYRANPNAAAHLTL
jgi:hypothetical protein